MDSGGYAGLGEMREVLNGTGADSPLLILTGYEGPECPFCGSEAELELMEVWGDRNYQISTCCEGLHDEACRLMAKQTSEGAQLLRSMGIEHVVQDTLRRVVDNGGETLVLDWKPRLCEISQSEAKAFVRAHHEHCPTPPVGWRFGGGLRNGSDLIGVVMVGRPVSRMLDADRIVEVNRNCVRRDIPSGLVWNACSQLYGYAAKEAKRRGFQAIVTYTLEEEKATTLKAAGWAWDGRTKGGSWSNEKRPRTDKSPTGPKNRWMKLLSKSARGISPRTAQKELAFA